MDKQKCRVAGNTTEKLKAIKYWWYNMGESQEYYVTSGGRNSDLKNRYCTISFIQNSRKAKLETQKTDQ